MNATTVPLTYIYTIWQNTYMNTQEYVNLRLHKTTLQEVKIVAALSHESMIQTIQRLVQQEKERLQKGDKSEQKSL